MQELTSSSDRKRVLESTEDPSVIALLMMHKDCSSNMSKQEINCTDETGIQTHYQPKFLEVYASYMIYLRSNSLVIPVHEHLFATCIEHMVTFCVWARNSPESSNWIFHTLLQNQDLRPELRNGLTMILLYTFASAHAKTLGDGSDFFKVIMDNTIGLGIIHKTSLRVYNDPFSFFIFLKLSITGLIECGTLKENERVSQSNPKTRRRHFEVESEFASFMEMKKLLVDLSKSNLNVLKAKIDEIMLIWQNKSIKLGQSRKFVKAVQILNSPVSEKPPNQGPLSRMITHTEYVVGNESMFPSTMQNYHHHLISNKPHIPSIQVHPSNESMSIGSSTLPLTEQNLDNNNNRATEAQVQLSISSAVHPIVGKVKAYSMKEKECMYEDSSHDNSENGESSGRTAVIAIRCDRVGADSWDMVEVHVSNVQSFLSMPTVNSIFAVDSNCFTAAEWENKKLTASGISTTPLLSSLKGRSAIKSSWPRTEFIQLRTILTDTIQSADSTNPVNDSMLATTKSNTGFKLFSGKTADRPVVLLYERLVQVGVVLRMNKALNIIFDSWRTLFNSEMEAFATPSTNSVDCLVPIDATKKANTSNLFVEFLANLFPQIRMSFYGLLPALDSIIVHYNPHYSNTESFYSTAIVPILSSHNHTHSPSVAYQCIGTLRTRTSEIFAR